MSFGKAIILQLASYLAKSTVGYRKYLAILLIKDNLVRSSFTVQTIDVSLHLAGDSSLLVFMLPFTQLRIAHFVCTAAFFCLQLVQLRAKNLLQLHSLSSKGLSFAFFLSCLVSWLDCSLLLTRENPIRYCYGLSIATEIFRITLIITGFYRS